MAQKLKVELQDSDGNIYYLHTAADVVFCGDGETVEHKLSNAIYKSNVINNCTSDDVDKPLAAAQGKTIWDKILEIVSSITTHKASTDHDGRYYTESEIDSKLGGKANSSHTHSAATQSANGLMSAGDKTKLDGIASGANAYSHPTGNGNNHIPSGGSSGQILRWSSAGTAAWGSDNNTTYGAATQSAQGLMSAADKKKLDGITAGANMLKSDIVNNCTSTNTDKPLAANQGKLLMDKYNQLNSDIRYSVIWRTTDINVGVLAVGGERFEQVSDLTMVNGYDTAGLAGFNLTGSGYTNCTVTQLNINGSKIHWSVKNVGEAQTGSIALHVNVMYMKSVLIRE